MNVFKRGRKAKEPVEEARLASPTTESMSIPSKMSRSLKRKQKNTETDTKPDFDLSSALPNTNDFRTSLIMPGLSARFSMLREQDDPTSMLGKASDDSVLFPKRASRMNLFNHNPLTDIAEVESIYSTIKAPFAENERSLSISEGYHSDNDSVMNRARPGEGNNLFGGRQKLYRIPTGSNSSRTLNERDSAALGKHMYENDVSMSMFQKLRKARQNDMDDHEEQPDSIHSLDHDEQHNLSSPMTAFSKNRGTSSSTNSGPSNRRTSTAATSVTSESPVVRQNTNATSSSWKSRTSDQGVGPTSPEVNVIGKSKSPVDFRSKINANLSPQKPAIPPLSKNRLSQSRSAVDLHDKYSRAAPVYSSNTFRAASPPASNANPLAALDFGLKDSTGRSSSQARNIQSASPTTQLNVGEDEDNIYTKNVQPNDRGKATALGLFNRPQQQFDEQQFLQRQLQMYEGRNSPMPIESRAESRASPELFSTIHPTGTSTPATRQTPEPVRAGSSTNFTSSASSPSHTSSRDPRSSSAFAPRSRKQSSASATVSPADNVKAKVQSLIRRQNEELAALETARPVTKALDGEAESPEEQSSSGTFFNNFDNSDEESDTNSSQETKRESPSFEPTEIHPALRNGTNDFNFGEDVTSVPATSQRQSHVSVGSNARSVGKASSIVTHSLQAPTPTIEESEDSPTLGPGTGLGLSGLIRTHLRQDSDRSSILPLSTDGPSRVVSMASTTRTQNPPASIHSDPWEFDNKQSGPHSTKAEPQLSDAHQAMAQRAQQILGQASMHRNQANNKAQRILGEDIGATTVEANSSKNWHDDLNPTHRRGESTETQKENREFDNELAERRRRILQGVAESDTRSRSPARQEWQNLPAQALSALKEKTGKMALHQRPMENSNNKAMKMLGISGGPDELPGRSPNGGRDYMFQNQHPAFRSDIRTPPVEPDFINGRRTPASAGKPQFGNDFYDDFERAKQRSATPNTGRASRNDRTYPDSAERSRSRPPRVRGNDVYPPVESGWRATSRSPPQRHNMYTPESPRDRRPSERSGSAMGNRARSGSRPSAPAYFDQKPGQYPPPPVMDLPGPPRPFARPQMPHSPVSPYESAMSPALSGPPSRVPSAAASPVMPSHPAPPLGGRMTPTGGRMTPVSGRVTPVSQVTAVRKKSVTKGMISEPTFISSTSSVPLVGLPLNPRPGNGPTPPIPLMNPRRRGTTISDRPPLSAGAVPNHIMGSPLPSMPESPVNSEFSMSGAHRSFLDVQKPSSKPRNRLRKSSSEGGNMAARARAQAIMSEMDKEKVSSPAVAVFPNRSATSLSTRYDGGMF